ncbi:essential protein Yae1, N terminal [Aspergillus brasiliensis]|uniref:Protein YAE1 n=1 Tax=Aspergillus brasiliensis TaxID=319629 RepID=A0A9W5YGS9_9EURO|nr:essential protein Yae1, N terminal [Aspergillus brasiliensis]GKZ46132.1 essential protein Yae1, N terminal [Aspergillus brasiliensis]
MSTLDDIFGSSPPPTTHHSHPTTTTSNEPSDLPSLRRQHVTAGYRDGISASKTAHVQSGFDAGFPIGAQLGMRAGTILGILEGVLRGYDDSQKAVVKKLPAGRRGVNNNSTSSTAATTISEERNAKRAEILALYQQAVKELDVRKVFEGISEREISEGEKAEVRLGRQGEGVVGKWEEKVSVPRWEENMDALELKDTDITADGEEAEEES